MPYALVVIGLIMIITGVLNTYAALAMQLQSDFTGDKSFIFWLIALGSVGALGYVNDLRQFSHYFMALILISMVLANRGVFAQFQAAIKSGPVAPMAQDTSSATSQPITAASSTATINSAIVSNQTGPFGSTPQTAGEAKAFGWFNFIGKSLFGG